MVIPDWRAPKPPQIEFIPAPQQPEDQEPFARPLDRLAAVIVDIFVLLVPAFILVSAPLQRGLDASKLLGFIPQWKALAVLMALLGIALLMIYQTFMHYFFSATVGKMLFDLRVRPMFKTDRMSVAGLMGRSLIWIFECLCLGIPMLAVFSNSKRRTWHDRIYDTVVVSRNNTFVDSPGIWERGVVRGFFGATIACALILAYFGIGTYFDSLRSENFGFSLANHQSSQCDIVDKYMEDQEPREHSRLQMALSLYSAGLVDPGCIDSELEREIARHTPVGPITYLAQAFVNSDDTEVYNSYLDQVCDEAPRSTECTMSKIAGSWANEDWVAVDDLLKHSERGSGYLDVWAVRFYIKQARYKDALASLDALVDHHELLEFTSVQRVKALFNGFAEGEADVALAQALPSLPSEDGENISSWLCAQEMQKGCSALGKLSCRRIQHEAKIKDVDFNRIEQSLAKVMTLECENQGSVDYATFSESVKDEDWQVFFRANYKLQRGDLQSAFRLFADVVDSNSASDMLRVEALRRLIDFADQDQLALAIKLWDKFDAKEAWARVGNLLFDRLNQKHDLAQAMRVARALMNAEAMSPTNVAGLTDLMHAQKREPASVAAPKLKDILKQFEAQEAEP